MLGFAVVHLKGAVLLGVLTFHVHAQLAVQRLVEVLLPLVLRRPGEIGQPHEVCKELVEIVGWLHPERPELLSRLNVLIGVLKDVLEALYYVFDSNVFS